MGASYEILRYRPEFREGVVRLHTHLLRSRDATQNEAYLSWKHEQNPYRRDPLIFLARFGKSVVGMRSFFETEWQVGNPSETFRALYADDFVIAPDHRDRGLASRIMETAFRQLRTGPHSYAINLSAGRVTRLASLAGGWRSAGPMLPFGRRQEPVDDGRNFGRWLRTNRIFRRLAQVTRTNSSFSRLDRWMSRQGETAGDRITVERCPRSNEMSELVSRLPFDGRIRHVRSVPFLSWRYCNPRRDYRFLYLTRDRLEGYVVLQAQQSEQGEGRVCIVDWEGIDEKVRSDLLQVAVFSGGFRELVLWTATLAPGDLRLLESRGFEHIDREETARGLPGLLVRSLDPHRLAKDWVVAGRRLLDLSQWDLRMIYSMRG